MTWDNKNPLHYDGVWVSSDEELPEEDSSTVLVCTDDGTIAMGFRYEGEWHIKVPPWDIYDGPQIGANVAYWMMLPLPPTDL